MSGLVSIITPVYNAEKYIETCISSVLSQTYDEWEMILVDDCSSDNSIQIIEDFAAKDNRIQLHKLGENSGPAVTRNKAIELAKGKYIAFLDSDDLWKPTKLEKQVGFMQKNDIALCHSSYEQIDENGNPLNKRIEAKPKTTYHQMLSSNRIGCLTGIYDAEKVGKILMPLIRKRQDYGLWLAIMRKGIIAYGIEESLAHYRIHTQSISNKKESVVKYNWQILRQHEQLPLPKALYHFIAYALIGLKKYYLK